MAVNDYKPLQITTFEQNMYAWLGVLENMGSGSFIAAAVKDVAVQYQSG